jgi:hypothetical protein
MIDLGRDLRIEMVAHPIKRKIRAIGANVINKNKLMITLMYMQPREWEWNIDEVLEEMYD